MHHVCSLHDRYYHSSFRQWNHTQGLSKSWTQREGCVCVCVLRAIDLLPPGSASCMIPPPNLARNLGFLNCQRQQTPGRWQEGVEMSYSLHSNTTSLTPTAGPTIQFTSAMNSPELVKEFSQATPTPLSNLATNLGVPTAPFRFSNSPK